VGLYIIRVWFFSYKKKSPPARFYMR